MLNNPRRLADLKPGDFVAEQARFAFGEDGLRKLTVTAVKKTKITTEGGGAWLVSTGHEYGTGHDRWHSGSWIEPWDDAAHLAQIAEYRREAKRKNAIRRIEGYGYRKLPDSVLDELAAVLDRHEAAQIVPGEMPAGEG